MKKIIFALSLLTSGLALADYPHIVPAPGCPAGNVCCPISAVCSYLDGCGELGPWQLNGGGMHKFDGLKTFNLIFDDYSPEACGNYPKSYTMECNYNGGENGMVRLATNNHSYSLVGVWQYGFAKQTATCPGSVSAACSGKG